MALLECEPLAKETDIGVIKNALATRCGCYPVTDWSEISASWGRQISGRQDHRVVLLIDGVDWLSPAMGRQLFMGLHIIHQNLSNAKIECHIAVSRRHVEDDYLRNLTTTIRKETNKVSIFGIGPSQNWYVNIPLSEFRPGTIRDLVREGRAAKPYCCRIRHLGWGSAGDNWWASQGAHQNSD